MDAAEPSYEEVPYPASPFLATHPDNLAATAWLYGLSAPPLGGARVLEIGCSDGGNLLPMAYALPTTAFLGIDRSPSAIALGKKTIAALGVVNLVLQQQDIMEFSAPEKSFDYIIAHGIYSWVPEPVRRRLLELMGRLLGDDGLAYLSFAALPGGYLAAAIDDMMRFHTRSLTSSAARLQGARDFARMLASVTGDDDPFVSVIRREAETIAIRHEELIVHDDLADHNHREWLHVMAARLAAVDLQFACHAVLTTAHDRHVAPIEPFLDLAGDDHIMRAQYADFARMRRFNQIIVARAGRAILPVPTAHRLKTLRLRAAVTTESGMISLRAGDDAIFSFNGKVNVTIRHPLTKAALLCLGEAFPQSVAFDPLLADSLARLRAADCDSGPPGDPADQLCDALIDLLGPELIQLERTPRLVPREAGAHPFTSALIRRQLGEGTVCTNVWHQAMNLDKPGHALLVQLDGTRDRAALADACGLDPAELDRMLGLLLRYGVLLESPTPAAGG